MPIASRLSTLKMPRFGGRSASPSLRSSTCARLSLLGDSEPEVRVGEPLVGGNRAAVEWWGTVKVEGEPHSFVGTAWLRFNDDGIVIEENDYWHSVPRRVEPWSGWGRNRLD